MELKKTCHRCDWRRTGFRKTVCPGFCIRGARLALADLNLETVEKVFRCGMLGEARPTRWMLVRKNRWSPFTSRWSKISAAWMPPSTTPVFCEMVCWWRKTGRCKHFFEEMAGGDWYKRQVYFSVDGKPLLIWFGWKNQGSSSTFLRLPIAQEFGGRAIILRPKPEWPAWPCFGPKNWLSTIFRSQRLLQDLPPPRWWWVFVMKSKTSSPAACRSEILPSPQKFRQGFSSCWKMITSLAKSWKSVEEPGSDRLRFQL